MLSLKKGFVRDIVENFQSFLFTEEVFSACLITFDKGLNVSKALNTRNISLNQNKKQEVENFFFFTIYLKMSITHYSFRKFHCK